MATTGFTTLRQGVGEDRTEVEDISANEEVAICKLLANGSVAGEGGQSAGTDLSSHASKKVIDSCSCPSTGSAFGPMGIVDFSVPSDMSDGQ